MKLRAALQAERPQVCGSGVAAISSATNSRAQPSKGTQPAPSIRDAGVGESDSSPESDMEHLITAPLHKSIVHQASAVTPKRVPPPAPAASAERISTRAQHRQAEIPVWTQPEEPSATITAAGSREGHRPDATPQHHDNPDNEELHQTNMAQTALPVPRWMPDTHIKLNTRGQVNIRDQQPHIQAMLRTSISLALHHIAFEDSFPDMNHTRRIVTDLLYAAANQTAGCERVRSRLVQDAQYVRVLSYVSSGRISKARTAVKVVAQRHVASVYQLEKGCSAEKINALLQRNMFIFPTDSNGTPIRSKPFQSPAIIRTIQDAFFHDDNSAGTKHHSSFVSTCQKRTDELELPPSMVALATTAVRSVIMDFLSDTVAEFNSTIFSGIYERLVDFINAIDRDSARKCHVLFALLYKLTHGTKNKSPDAESGEMMLMHIDLDAMAEE
ncbi:hypothetical protein PAXRUDRAFT_836256 [Paxillus rubicundulus Ve08.2h10]|uniref:DUF6532 domain-containing protein n=1 Tax=Paxillus rubicundulus Ve08.2h10 TaxID=930991 RepID=A0A0D0D0Y2_9AGAM|nr:hypothetical protein PAXRUDRAFT_836256 [Paxillus rubicundulus Ve08.2h10]